MNVYILREFNKTWLRANSDKEVINLISEDIQSYVRKLCRRIKNIDKDK